MHKATVKKEMKLKDFDKNTVFGMSNTDGKLNIEEVISIHDKIKRTKSKKMEAFIEVLKSISTDLVEEKFSKFTLKIENIPREKYNHLMKILD